VRIEGVALKHHGHVALVGRHVVDDLAVEVDVALGQLLEAGDHVERRGLAAARRPQEDHEFLVANLHVQAIDGDDVAVAFGHVVEQDAGHGRATSAYPFTAPAVRPETR
jgi:hypothetical protein